MNIFPNSDFSERNLLAFLSLCLCVSAVNYSCSSKPTDVRTALPADALVYLESRDLGQTISAVTESPKFAELAAGKPDLSSLNGVQMAVAVTGFETSEEQIAEQQFEGRITPHFVAVAETNAWSWQAESFVENKLGEFVNELYGGAVELEMSPKKDGRSFVWTSQDGRKAFAHLQGSLIFFGNDPSAIEKALAVRRGEADSIANNPKIAPPDGSIAYGYISPDGVGQLANIYSTALAAGTSEEAEVQSFIARVLPEVLRNSVKEVSWYAERADSLIRDKYSISLDPEAARIFNDTLASANAGSINLESFVPAEKISATRYNLKNPPVAWSSVIQMLQARSDDTSGSLIAAVSVSLFEPYGVEHAELFLASVGQQLVTVTFDEAGESGVVIAAIANLGNLKKSVAKEIGISQPPVKQGRADVWKSEDGDLAAAILEDKMIVGDAEGVTRCLAANNSEKTRENRGFRWQTADPNPVVITFGRIAGSPAAFITVLSEKKNPDATIAEDYTVETRFTANGIERATVSDFGVIGDIIEQFVRD
ncbi:MAG: hypothetical protein ABR535_05200 [Pyrinomonadaceae bacterium]